MAYADQSISNRRIIAIVIVGLLHAVIGYAFITGLGYKYVKQAMADLKTFDVADEPPPPPDEPPPPVETPKVQPPPVVAPPPIVAPPTIQLPPIQATPNPPPPLHIEAPAPPPPPAQPPKSATAKGDPGSWISDADYPPAAIRENRQGTTAIAWEINPAGRVENCHVTQSSGSPDLDETACRVFTRRGRFSPAKDATGTAIRSNMSRRVRWVVPKR